MFERAAVRVLQAGALLVVLAATPYKTFELDRFFVPKELVLHVTAAVALLLVLPGIRRAALARVDQLLALFLALGLVSALFATNWWLAERAVGVSLAGATCFWVARHLARGFHRDALVSALALAAIVGAVTALLQTYGVRTEYVSLNRAPGGTFGNRNFMAHLSAIAMPALLYCALVAKTRGAFLRWNAGIALVAAALILSRSRAAWLSLIVCALVLLPLGVIALRRTGGAIRLRRLFVTVLFAAAGAGASLVLPNSLDWKSDSPYLDTARSVVNYKGGSGRGRLVQYGNTLKMSLRHPLLGVGPGNWAVVYPRFASRNDPSLTDDGMTANPWPSSDWMTFVSERGLASFVVLLLAVIALATDGLRAARREADPHERLAACTLVGTLAVLVVVGSFDAVLLLPVNALVAWALLGALSPPSRERRVVEPPALARVGVGLVVVALGGLAAARSATQIGAMSLVNGTTRTSSLERAASLDPGSYRVHVKLGAAYLSRGSCGKAVAHAEAARALFPNAAEPRRVLAGCGR